MQTGNLPEILQECLDKIQRGELTKQECLDLFPEYREELSSLLSQVEAFSAFSQQQPDSLYKVRSKNRLYAQISANIPAVAKKTARRSSTFSLRPILTATLVVLISLSTVVGGVQAADQAAPGDWLYPVDLALEDTQLYFASGNIATARLHLEFASERVQEAERKFDAGEQDNGISAINHYNYQMLTVAEIYKNSSETERQAIDEAAQAFEANNTLVLTALLDKVPAQARDAILHALDASDHASPANNNSNSPVLPTDAGDDLQVQVTETPTDKDIEKEEKEAEKEATQEAKEEDKEEKEATKDADKEEKDATKEADKEDKEQDKIDKEETKEADKEDKEQDKADKDATKDAEKEDKKN